MSPTDRIKTLAVLIAITVGIAGVALVAQVLDRSGRRRMLRWERRVAAAAWVATGIGVACFLYALWIEARWVEVTFHQVRTSKLKAGERFRIVHVTDLHVDGPHPNLDLLASRVNALAPDLFIHTGDTLNAEVGVGPMQAALRGVEARLGRFAVRGNHDVWYWPHVDLFGDGVATELVRKPVQAGPMVLCGAPYGVIGHLRKCLESAPEAFRVLVYHTPDLVEEFAGEADLYLAGHTHGGQVRLPFYGALITESKFDKKYEMGRYQVDRTTLYVNRGLGFERDAPKIRFLCRPEIAVIDVVGE